MILVTLIAAALLVNQPAPADAGLVAATNMVPPGEPEDAEPVPYDPWSGIDQTRPWLVVMSQDTSPDGESSFQPVQTYVDAKAELLKQLKRLKAARGADIDPNMITNKMNLSGVNSTAHYIEWLITVTDRPLSYVRIVWENPANALGSN